jgi:hypothetical protein
MQHSQFPGQKAPEEADYSNPPLDAESQEEAPAQKAAQEADYSNPPLDAESQQEAACSVEGSRAALEEEGDSW